MSRHVSGSGPPLFNEDVIRAPKHPQIFLGDKVGSELPREEISRLALVLAIAPFSAYARRGGTFDDCPLQEMRWQPRNLIQT